MRYLLSCFLIFSVVGTCFGQMPDGLNAEQTKQMLNKAYACFVPRSDFDFTFQSNDLRPDHPTPVPYYQTTDSELRKLKNGLKGHKGDAKLCFEIGSIYKRRYEYRNAGKWLSKADSFYLMQIGENNMDAHLWTMRGRTLMELGKIEPAIISFSKALQKDNKDSTARGMLPTLLMLKGDLESARKVITENMKTPTDELADYAALSSLHFFEFFSSEHAQKLKDDNNYYLTHPIDSLYDFTPFEEKAKKSRDYSFTLLHQLTRHMGLLSKSYFTFDRETKRFNMSADDLKELTRLEKFYKKGIKNKKFTNKYIFYNALACSRMLQNQPGVAIRYYEQAKKCRPVSQGTPSNHTGGLYNNIMAAHLLKGDTAAALKELDSKIKSGVTIDPRPGDYSLKAKFAAAEKDLEAVSKHSYEALAIDTTHLDGYLGLAFTSLIKGEYHEVDKHIDIILGNNPNDLNATILLGIRAAVDNDLSTADFIFKRVLEINPDDQLVKDIRTIYLKE